MNDISKNAADSVAQQYQGNINLVQGLVKNQLGNTDTALGQQGELANAIRSNSLSTNTQNAGIYNNLISNATQPITVAAAAQEAAQNPAINLWNASLGLNSAGNSALAAVSGKGTTTSTSSNGGGGFMSGLLGGLF
jgi:hypothetical protein